MKRPVREPTPGDTALHEASGLLGSEIIGLDHIAIAVTDLDEGIAWYCRNLGFKVLDKHATRGERTGMVWAVLVSGGVVIVLVQGTEPQSQVSRFIAHFGPGVQHVAFGVRDLDAAVRGVTEASGGLETPVIQDVGIRQAFLRRDPGSGVRVELIERKGGDFSDESVNELFRAFEKNDLY